MASFNLVVIMGNLTRTPELRSLPSGTQVTDLTLAINDTFTDKSGNKQERVTFVDVTFWGKQAETLCRWKKQGDPLQVQGRLQQDKWTDKETGQARSKLKVVGVGFVFLGSKRDDAQGDTSNRHNYGKQSGALPGNDDGGSYDDYATSLPNTSGEEPPF